MERVSLVKINDKWAVEIISGRIFKHTKYLDLEANHMTWDRDNRYFKDCLGTEAVAREAYNNFSPNIEVIESKLIK
jgi:hypothetical protein